MLQTSKETDIHSAVETLLIRNPGNEVTFLPSAHLSQQVRRALFLLFPESLQRQLC